MIFEDNIISEESVAKFQKLPYKNKIIIMGMGIADGENILRLDKPYGKNYVQGDILAYKSRISVIKYLDKFDFVHFFNTGTIRK